LDDALDGLRSGGGTGEADIRAEAAKKVSVYYASLSSEKEYKALEPRIKQFFQDRP
jgi:hypothetical protein